jgi:IclR family mhp operon transcriptional activator
VLGPVGVKLSYIHTATGRAYLAACGEAEREAIIARLRPKETSEGTEEDLRRSCSRRERGHASREPLHPWPDRSRQLVLRDGRRSMAVPIIVEGTPVAAINVTWPARRGAEEAVIARNLEALRRTARIIGLEIEGRTNKFRTVKSVCVAD